ncbi:MAG: hypothetical protein B9S33_03245 [Pedosphaera sp. Tous-C6FEB]|nr:MAG: hypothetical protein B9S33_03245 [Pedosphaera sp. Tous-C6FEB]
MSTPRWRIVHSEASAGWGGQEHRVVAELTGFQRRGHPVWLLAPPAAQITQRAQAAGVPVLAMSGERWRFPFDALRLAWWLRREQIQIVNTHSSRDGWLVGTAARLARVPLLIRSRHIDLDYPRPWISRPAFTTLADHVLATSDKITTKFQQLFQIPADRISTVPTGIDITRFQPAGPKAALELPPAVTGLPLVGMISVLRSGKGHPTFLQAARELNEGPCGRRAHFLIVGGGAPREAMEKMVRDHGAESHVTLTGHREDVPELLRTLQVMVIPSLHEGIPQIGLQALACQTPVVGSDSGGIPEIIRAGETGRIFPAGDAGALARTITEALDQPDATRAMAARGRELVEHRYSQDTMLDVLEGIYRRYLKDPSKRT